MSNKFLKAKNGVSLEPQSTTPSGIEDGDIYHDQTQGLMVKTGGVIEPVKTTDLDITEITGLGTGVADFLATPSSANLKTALTDETGSGPAVFATEPQIENPTIDNGLTILHETTPATPPAGRIRVYSKNDNGLYILDSDGIEKKAGSGGMVPDIKSGSFTADIGYHYLTNTSGGAFNAILPAGADKSVMMFSDTLETWDINALTIVPASGEKIDGLAVNETLVCDVKRGWVELTWNTVGSFWSIRSQNSIQYNAQTGSYKAVTGTYAIGLADYFISASGASNYTVTLPSAVAAGAGRIFVIKSNMNVGVLLNIGTTSSQTIDGVNPGVTPRTLSRFESLQLMSNGSNWVIF